MIEFTIGFWTIAFADALTKNANKPRFVPYFLVNGYWYFSIISRTFPTSHSWNVVKRAYTFWTCFNLSPDFNLIADKGSFVSFLSEAELENENFSWEFCFGEGFDSVFVYYFGFEAVYLCYDFCYCFWGLSYWGAGFYFDTSCDFSYFFSGFVVFFPVPSESISKKGFPT